MRDLADALIARGHGLRLVTSHRGWPHTVVEDGLEVVRQWRPPERPLGALGFPPGTSAAPGAWARLRRGHDDVVQAWTLPAALAAARSGKPSVFVFQGVLHQDDLTGRPRVRAMLERAARRCDVVTTYGELAATEFERLTGVRARAIEPGIRLDAFVPDLWSIEPPLGGPSDHNPASGRRAAPVVFCAADPDEPRKRVPLLVEAFARVRRDLPEAELWLMKTRDAAIAARPGVHIVDPGADRDELVRLYRSAWVSVLPAFREAFGLVAVESLACGTPVIAMADGAGARTIVEGASGDPRGAAAGDPRGPASGRRPRPGRIADPDPDALAGVLREALAAPPDPPTVAACRRRAEDFSIDRCAERYEALYHELTA